MYEILMYNGTFYKFTEMESGGYPRTHIVAGEVNFKDIAADDVIIVPLINKWGFCMKTPHTTIPDNWQVFDTREECQRKADEYHDKVVVPLNESWEKRKKSGEFDKGPEISDLDPLDTQD